uniref:Uncharacterized protein n=1 Tax=Romanomermis culicivorax TaxID=13658 RepID=A0A915HWR3_ROMCU
MEAVILAVKNIEVADVGVIAALIVGDAAIIEEGLFGKILSQSKKLIQIKKGDVDKNIQNMIPEQMGQ